MEGIEKRVNDTAYGFFYWLLMYVKRVLMKVLCNALRALPAASQVFDFLWFQQKSS